ncbi:unnamed protein product [Lampetra fluviatilis]
MLLLLMVMASHQEGFLDELPRFVVLSDYSPPRPAFVDRYGVGRTLPGFSVALWDFRPRPNSSNDVLERGLRARREGTEDSTRDFNRRRELFAAHFPIGRLDEVGQFLY